MKKIFVTLAAALLLLGCSKTTYIGNQELNTSIPKEDMPILFGSGNHNATTRAEVSGLPAAQLLGYRFEVFGTKTTTAGQIPVFANANPMTAPYWVWYVDGTNNQTLSNTKGWEYVGGTGLPYGTPSHQIELNPSQTIKFWDYGASDYTFCAWSDLNVAADRTGAIVTPAISGNAVTNYTMAITSATDAAKVGNVYFAQRLRISKTANSDATQYNKYGGIVRLTFANAAAKIRIGFYETIPGYSVTINKFYTANNLTSQVDRANLIGEFENEGTYTVTYGTETGSAPEFLSPVQYNYVSTGTTAALAIGTAIPTSALGETASNATYVDGGLTNNFQYVLPTVTGGTGAKDFMIRLDYTLTAPNGETIQVKGATAKVPAVYNTWLPNFAYTYIFKISRNTSGTTGNPEDPEHPGTGGGGTTPDPESLYPITFDAVVSSDFEGNQETITTVADPSITTYASASNVTVDDEYKKGSNIYISVFGQPISSSNSRMYTATIETGALQEINEGTVANVIKKNERYTYTAVTAGTTLTLSHTYYLADYVTKHIAAGTEVAAANQYFERATSASGVYVVADAGGKEMAVAPATAPTVVSTIPAAEAPHGVAITDATNQFACITPNVAGIYVFEYDRAAVAAVLYADVDEYNAAKGTTLDAAAFAALSVEERTKIPAIPAAKCYKVIKVID